MQRVPPIAPQLWRQPAQLHGSRVRFDRTTDLKQDVVAGTWDRPGNSGSIERVFQRWINGFDYIVQHGKAIANAGMAFDSCAAMMALSLCDGSPCGVLFAVVETSPSLVGPAAFSEATAPRPEYPATVAHSAFEPPPKPVRLSA